MAKEKSQQPDSLEQLNLARPKRGEFKDVELTPEQDEDLKSILIEAKQAEKEGDKARALELYIEYKNEFTKIKEEKEVEQYGEFKILKPQVEFLEGVEDHIIFLTKELGKDLSREKARKRISKMVGKVDENGNVTELYLLGLSLKELPSNIDNLSNLKIFKCFNNRLSSLPDTISNLSKLEKLECFGNEFNKTEERKIKKLFPFAEV